MMYLFPVTRSEKHSNWIFPLVCIHNISNHGSPKQQSWFLHFPAFLSQTGPTPAAGTQSRTTETQQVLGSESELMVSESIRSFIFWRVLYATVTLFRCWRLFLRAPAVATETACGAFLKWGDGDQCCASLIWALCSSMTAATPPHPPNQNTNQ